MGKNNNNIIYTIVYYIIVINRYKYYNIMYTDTFYIWIEHTICILKDVLKITVKKIFNDL